MKLNVKTAYINETCILRAYKYMNDRVALQLISLKGEPVARITVNVEDAKLNDDDVCIKDYSENAGMLDAMINAGVVAPPHREIAQGFVNIPVCRLLIKPEELNKKES